MSRSISLSLVIALAASTAAAHAGPSASSRLRRQRNARERRTTALEAHGQRLQAAHQQGYETARAEGEAELGRLRNEARELIRNLHRQLHYARMEIAEKTAALETCRDEAAEAAALAAANEERREPIGDPLGSPPAQEFVEVPDLRGTSGPFGLTIQPATPARGPAARPPTVDPDLQRLVAEKVATLRAREEDITTQLSSARNQLWMTRREADVHRQTIQQMHIRLKAELRSTPDEDDKEELRTRFRDTGSRISKARHEVLERIPALETRIRELEDQLSEVHSEQDRYRDHVSRSATE